MLITTHQLDSWPTNQLVIRRELTQLTLLTFLHILVTHVRRS